MTQPATELTDPGSAFLGSDPGSAFLASGNPERFLTDNLPSTDRPVAAHHGHTKAAVEIAAAFMIWRLYMTRQLRAEQPPVEPRGLLDRLWQQHMPWWMTLATPVFVKMFAAQPPSPSQQELEAVAVDYAARLGDYVHQTSSDALVAGYHQELTAGTSPTLAWMRSVEGYGLDTARLQAWLRSISQDRSASEDLLSPGARRALDRALLLRADVLGDTEAWQARFVGKSILWMWQEAHGELPPGSTKRWLTADDERVCVICGPLHRHQVALTAPFVLPDGRRLWAPGVHPNCRCTIDLVVPTDLYVEKRLRKHTRESFAQAYPPGQYQVPPRHLDNLQDNQPRDPEKVAALAADISRHGIKKPLAVNTVEGAAYLMNGHHRQLAARKLRLRRVPVQVNQGPYVSKNQPGDPYDRDRQGRFARQESRTREQPNQAPPVRERDVLPEVEALLAQEPVEAPVEVPVEAPVEVPVEAPPTVGTIFDQPWVADNVENEPNIFGTAPVQYDVLGDQISLHEPDIFGEEALGEPDIFNEEPDIFAEPEPTTIILLPRVPQETSAPVEVPFTDVTPKPGAGGAGRGAPPRPPDFETVLEEHGFDAALPADDYFGAQLKSRDQLHLAEFGMRPPEAPAGRQFAVGERINMDEVLASINRSAFLGSWVNERNRMEDMLESLSEGYSNAAWRVGGEEPPDTSAIDAARYNLRAHLTGDPEATAEHLADEDIYSLYQQIGEEERADNMDIDQLRDNYIERLGNEKDPLSEATFQYWLENMPTPDYEAAKENFEDSLGGGSFLEDYIRTPQFFVFPEGHIGGWTSSGSVPLIRGQYIVKATRFHDLTDMSDPEGSSLGPTPRIKNWIEVQLVPVNDTPEDADLPHDRHPEVE